MNMFIRNRGMSFITVLFSVVLMPLSFAQPLGSNDPYKRDRYTGLGSPSDRVYERDGPEMQTLALKGNEYLYEWLSTVGDFDQDNKEDIVFFRKLSPEHYVLVVVSDYYDPFQWGERETVLGEFFGLHSMYDLMVSRTRMTDSFKSQCPFYSAYPNFVTSLKSTESQTLSLAATPITVGLAEEWITLVLWNEDEYKYFCWFNV